ncbi:hypothetical protein BJY01DRAFT_172445 [Aspergillus pseudoustus]|uniref:Uncharacterized protein n=1 Tax=Aspergillus pseudoustus TaxID=1810923 RepID=A0ABR4K3H3_9EURO
MRKGSLRGVPRLKSTRTRVQSTSTLANIYFRRPFRYIYSNPLTLGEHFYHFYRSHLSLFCLEISTTKHQKVLSQHSLYYAPLVAILLILPCNIVSQSS